MMAGTMYRGPGSAVWAHQKACEDHDCGHHWVEVRAADWSESKDDEREDYLRAMESYSVMTMVSTHEICAVHSP